MRWPSSSRPRCQLDRLRQPQRGLAGVAGRHQARQERAAEIARRQPLPRLRVGASEQLAGVPFFQLRARGRCSGAATIGAGMRLRFGAVARSCGASAVLLCCRVVEPIRIGFVGPIFKAAVADAVRRRSVKQPPLLDRCVRIVLRRLLRESAEQRQALVAAARGGEDRHADIVPALPIKVSVGDCCDRGLDQQGSGASGSAGARSPSALLPCRSRR